MALNLEALKPTAVTIATRRGAEELKAEYPDWHGTQRIRVEVNKDKGEVVFFAVDDDGEREVKRVSVLIGDYVEAKGGVIK